MGKMQREKGKRGERLWASKCREYGYDVHRTSQYCGQTGDASDCVGIPGIHQEVKYVEHLNIRDAMDQAIRDAQAANKGEIPIVAHKKNNCSWLVTMRAEDFFVILCEFESDLLLREAVHD